MSIAVVGGDTSPDNDTADASIDVLCPDLGITKTADDTTVDAGDAIGFTITVANAGGADVGTARGATVHDLLPAGAGISWSIESQTGVGADCTVTDGVLDCGPVDLAPGDSFAVHVVSDTPSGLTNGSLPAACKVYDNTATAEATNVAALTASASTEVLCPLAIQIVKDGPATASRGDIVTYTFTVTNTGKADLVKVDLTDAKCDAGTITEVDAGDGDSTLAIGETWKFTCTRLIRADDPDPLPNTATVQGTDVHDRTTTATDDHVIDILEPVTVLGTEVTRDLPRTGLSPWPFLTLAALLLALGGGMVLWADAHLRSRAATARQGRRRR